MSAVIVKCEENIFFLKSVISSEWVFFVLEVREILSRNIRNIFFGKYKNFFFENNFRTTSGFFIVILTSLLCLYLIGSLLSVFFYT